MVGYCVLVAHVLPRSRLKDRRLCELHSEFELPSAQRCWASCLANCASPLPTDQFSFAASIRFTNTSSGLMPALSRTNSAIHLKNAFFCCAVRVLNMVIWI